MRRYLVVYATTTFGSSSFYSRLVNANTIGEAVMRVQSEQRQVVNVIPLGSLD